MPVHLLHLEAAQIGIAGEDVIQNLIILKFMHP